MAAGASVGAILCEYFILKSSIYYFRFGYLSSTFPFFSSFFFLRFVVGAAAATIVGGCTFFFSVALTQSVRFDDESFHRYDSLNMTPQNIHSQTVHINARKKKQRKEKKRWRKIDANDTDMDGKRMNGKNHFYMNTHSANAKRFFFGGDEDEDDGDWQTKKN